MYEPDDESLLVLIDDLAEHGWSLRRDFLPQTLTAQLARECRAQAAAGEMNPAAIGRAAGQQIVEGIRGDQILWIEPGQSEACDSYLALMDSVRQQLNRHLFLGLEDLECHFAFYPPGAFYQRHLDRFRDDDCRTVTVVLYLNEADWSDGDGGELRLWLRGGDVRELSPLGGTLACFLSGEFPHEVLPASRDRLSLTGWFRRRAENPLNAA